ncbi:MAG TPA: UDP-2,3-diacylglucosamine diphosphatase [Planctomycetota bacterium]|nr:UDP-2,3-diacylglucosamine diphosphatase [Planctomycetota bacterium]
MVLPLPPPKLAPARPHKYFISDLHLDGSDSPHALKFRAFLKRLAEEAATQPTELFILGDLFEFWTESHPALFGIYDKDLDALEHAFKAGVQIYVLYGNRDFSYGKYSTQRFGATCLGDGQQITLSDTRPVWLEHGDLLCTGDRSYLLFRKFVRSWPARFLFWMMPWSMASKTIARMKARSAKAKKAKDPKQFEVDLEFSRRRLEEKKCRVLICGHTHVPQATDLGAGYRLIVLPAWCQEPAGYVDDGTALHPFTA